MKFFFFFVHPPRSFVVLTLVVVVSLTDERFARVVRFFSLASAKSQRKYDECIMYFFFVNGILRTR